MGRRTARPPSTAGGEYRRLLSLALSLPSVSHSYFRRSPIVYLSLLLLIFRFSTRPFPHILRIIVASSPFTTLPHSENRSIFRHFDASLGGPFNPSPPGHALRYCEPPFFDLSHSDRARFHAASLWKRASCPLRTMTCPSQGRGSPMAQTEVRSALSTTGRICHALSCPSQSSPCT